MAAASLRERKCEQVDTGCCYICWQREEEWAEAGCPPCGCKARPPKEIEVLSPETAMKRFLYVSQAMLKSSVVKKQEPCVRKVTEINTKVLLLHYIHYRYEFIGAL